MKWPEQVASGFAQVSVPIVIQRFVVRNANLSGFVRVSNMAFGQVQRSRSNFA